MMSGFRSFNVLAEVFDERRRQIEQEGFDEGHDQEHVAGELAMAAASYAVTAGPEDQIDIKFGHRQNWRNGGWATLSTLIWPWASSWWKPTTPRRNLIKAAALIVAEIERIDRKGEPT